VYPVTLTSHLKFLYLHFYCVWATFCHKIWHGQIYSNTTTDKFYTLLFEWFHHCSFRVKSTTFVLKVTLGIKISLNFHRWYLLPLIKSFPFHWCCWLIDHGGIFILKKIRFFYALHPRRVCTLMLWSKQLPTESAKWQLFLLTGTSFNQRNISGDSLERRMILKTKLKLKGWRLFNWIYIKVGVYFSLLFIFLP